MPSRLSGRAPAARSRPDRGGPAVIDRTSTEFYLSPGHIGVRDADDRPPEAMLVALELRRRTLRRRASRLTRSNVAGLSWRKMVVGVIRSARFSSRRWPGVPKQGRALAIWVGLQSRSRRTVRVSDRGLLCRKRQPVSERWSTAARSRSSCPELLRAAVADVRSLGAYHLGCSTFPGHERLHVFQQVLNYGRA